ncbi:MAG: LysR family transcriptional regulator [Gammaproteobacteria bacterium]|nr:LysR family transcriptional regulator [Gammaproteobacteria bacterium]
MRRLNFHHLHYFWAVAREGNLTRAADSLHVSQSALSTQIRALEEQLGHDLFIRSGRQLLLTEAGHMALEYADNIFALGNELQTTLKGSLQSVQKLRVGAVATLSRNFQENLLRPFLGRHDVQLTLESGSLEDMLERLDRHTLDIVLSNRAVSSDAGQRWHCRELDRQSVCLVGPPRQSPAPFDVMQGLQGARLITPGSSSDVRRQFTIFCDNHGIYPDICAEVDDMAMLRLLARDSGDMALLPAVVVQDELQSGCLSLYTEIPGLVEQFYAITPRRHLKKGILDTLLDRP